LQRVIGVLQRAKHAIAMRVHPCTVRLKQRSKRRVLATGRGSKQGSIGGIRTSLRVSSVFAWVNRPLAPSVRHKQNRPDELQGGTGSIGV
jgi:hypothetical protein